MHQVLRWWLIGTVVAVTAMLVWAFVPVLVPVFGVTVLIGGVAALMIGLARGLEARLARRRAGQSTANGDNG